MKPILPAFAAFCAIALLSSPAGAATCSDYSAELRGFCSGTRFRYVFA